MNSGNQPFTVRSTPEEWASIMELAVREVFELMLGVKVTTPQEEAAPAVEITSMVGFGGQWCGVLSVRCSRETAVRMAAKMLGVALANDSQDVQDAFGELCNMIAGNFKNKIAGMSASCVLSVPTVVSGDDYSVYSLGDSDVLEVPLLFEGMPFITRLDIHSA